MSSLRKFDFKYLDTFTHNLPASSPFLFRPYSNQSILTLTCDGCKVAVENGAAWYSREDMYDRILLWRVPLIALWATTTLPSFGLLSQIFTLTHLIADPIDTVWSLLYKLHLAQRTERWARQYNEGKGGGDVSFVFKSEYTTIQNASDDTANGAEVRSLRARAERINGILNQENSPLLRYFHEVVALIITAYDEWGYGEHATKAMNYGFNMKRWTGVQRTKFRNMCQDTAFYIASDRVSRFLPSITSGIVFLAQISSSFWKTLNALGDTYDASNPVSAGLNRAPHNIAFGILFFWLPSVVLLTALVGGSQTSHLIPRVLQNFRSAFERHKIKAENEQDSLRAVILAADLDNKEEKTFPDISSELYERWKWGGLPVWQIEKFKDFSVSTDSTEKGPDHRLFAKLAILLSFSIVAIPAGCAILMSWLTPTQGFGCREFTQLLFLLMWIGNAMSDWGLFVYARRLANHGLASPLTANRDGQPGANVETQAAHAPYTSIYWVTFGKDLFFTVGIIVTLTFSALGMYNQCNCWSNWSFSTRYISFLQDDFIFQMIRRRLRTTFPIITGCALASEVLLFILVWWYFQNGWRVLKQRDMDSALASRNPW